MGLFFFFAQQARTLTLAYTAKQQFLVLALPWHFNNPDDVAAMDTGVTQISDLSSPV